MNLSDLQLALFFGLAAALLAAISIHFILRAALRRQSPPIEAGDPVWLNEQWAHSGLEEFVNSTEASHPPTDNLNYDITRHQLEKP